MEQVAGDLKGEGVVAMINVDENQQAAKDFGIRGIPALVVVRNGKPVGQIRAGDRASIAAEFRDSL